MSSVSGVCSSLSVIAGRYSAGQLEDVRGSVLKASVPVHARENRSTLSCCSGGPGR